MAIGLFVAVFIVLLTGFPVAFALAGTALLFAGLGSYLGHFDSAFLEALPNRLYGIMRNETLIAVPLFVFMGVTLERSKIAEHLITDLNSAFASVRGGLGVAVMLVGLLMAASTGIVGATVVTMGLLSLPTLLKQGYHPAIACGALCASGTLGQIIPPSIVLVLLGDILSNAYQQAQLNMGIFAPETVSVGDLFVGALLPGLLLVFMYLLFLIVLAYIKPAWMPRPTRTDGQPRDVRFWLRLLADLAPPLLLMLAVLGSIIAGFATPTEAAALGATLALVLALLRKQLSFKDLTHITRETTKITSMVFAILIGAALFSLTFRGFGGEELIVSWLSDLPGGKTTALLVVMLLMFLLGFVLDFIEIVFVIVPIVGPVLLTMDINPIWLGILIAMNLQTSFLTPPFGFALFYLRGVAPAEIQTRQIYWGVLPFIVLQLIMLSLLWLWPELVTWLPQRVYGES